MKKLRSWFNIVMIVSITLGCNAITLGSKESEAPAPSDSDTAAAEEEYHPIIEDLKVQGKVVLPQGAGLLAQELSVFSNAGGSAVDANGSFQLPAMRAPNNTLLILALNQQENAVLMGLLYPGQEAQPLELSLESTARALVLFDVNFLAQPQDQQAYALDLLDSLMDYETLLSTLAETLAQDPAAPLDGDAHPELYCLAAGLTKQIGTLMGIWEFASASKGAPGFAALRQVSPIQRANEYVWVEDDMEHNLPTVKLMNASWCFYKATIQTGDSNGMNMSAWNNTQSKPMVLDRVKPYTLNNSTTSGVLQVTDREVSLGDRYLQFSFEKDYDTTIVELIGSTIQLVLGVSPGSPEAMFLANIASSGADLVQEAIVFVKTLKGKSIQEAGSEFGLFFSKVVFTQYKEMFQLQMKLLQREAPEKYLKAMGKVFLSKALFVAEVAYAMVDMAPVAYCLANAPDKIEEGGLQKEGRYPGFLVEVTPNPILLEPAAPGSRPDSAISEPASFTVTVRELSSSIDYVRFQVNYGDDSEPEVVNIPVEDHKASAMFEHAYLKVPDFVRILVYDNTKENVLLGEELAWVEMGERSINNKEYTLNFRFDNGCDGAFVLPRGGDARVSPVKLVINGTKATVYRDKANDDKQLVAIGSGTYDPATGYLEIPEISSVYTIQYTDFEGNMLTGTETFIGSLTATITDDPAIKYESFSGALTGAVDVAYPNSEPPDSPSNAHFCVQSAISVDISEGFVDSDL